MKTILLLLVFAACHPIALALSPAVASDGGQDGTVAITGTGGVLGIVWGSVPSQAKSAMEGHPQFKLMRSSPEQIEYVGGTFAGIPVEMLRLDFVKGRFATAEITFEIPNIRRDTGWAGSVVVEAVRNALKEKYGEPNSVNTGQHQSDRWNVGETAGSKDAEKIELYDGWNAQVVKLIYNGIYFQRLDAPEAADVKPDDL